MLHLGPSQLGIVTVAAVHTTCHKTQAVLYCIVVPTKSSTPFHRQSPDLKWSLWWHVKYSKMYRLERDFKNTCLKVAELLLITMQIWLKFKTY